MMKKHQYIWMLSGVMGSYPQEMSGFGPARTLPADAQGPNSAHISFTPNVTYSLMPGMTPVQGILLSSPAPLNACANLLVYSCSINQRTIHPFHLSSDFD